MRFRAPLAVLLSLGAAAACGSSKKGTGTGSPGDAGVDQGAGGAGGGSGGGGGPGTGGMGAGTGGDGGAGGAGGTGGAGGAGGAGGSPTGSGGAGGCPTTLSGTVMDPAGVFPVYNAIVYVPGGPVATVPDGVSCDRCGGPLSGQPITAALTGADGKFRLDGVPPGTDVPLVVQLGKWRRQVAIPNVAACADNSISDANLTRLPRSSSEGHLPQIAVVTGHASALDCFLRRIGIADTEFTSDTGAGRVHLYAGGAGVSSEGATQLSTGEAFSSAYTALFPDPQRLARYDILMLACEGEQLVASKAPYYENVKAYADRGGRLIVEHLQFPWIGRGVPPWPATAQWNIGIDPGPLTASVDTTFPGGAAFAAWLTVVGASTTTGQIALATPQNTVSAIAAPAQRWLFTVQPSTSPLVTPVMSFNTPIEAPIANQCGRVQFLDLHAAIASGVSHPETPFPNGCTPSGALSAEERALEFLFFEAGGCVQSDAVPPVAPGSGGGGPEPDMLTGKKALLVVNDPTMLDGGETVLKADLAARGMTVTLATANGPAALATGQNLIIGSSTAAGDAFATTFKDVTVPILVFGNGYDIPLGFAASGTGSTGSVSNQNALTVVGTGTPLTADLAANTSFTAYSPLVSASVYWGAPGGTPIAMASASGSASQAVAFAFEKGAPMAAGTAAQRRIALGWILAQFPNLSVPAYKLTLAAIKWAANPPP